MISKAEMLLAYAGLDGDEAGQLVSQIMGMSDVSSDSAAVSSVFGYLGLER